ncbi:endonuclease/exonuclease/phosphatase, putative [Leishmania tarentolae]|uniref:Endonuclease/exonuclease/phosphatase, putative n=1 Tax=Leishmania tarentolae TaxID=5689 RepID=A0A640KTU0_LEITA|nr:endonuclease/exonuclease/phosphatase, putative [Leishmania tarentolae]
MAEHSGVHSTTLPESVESAQPAIPSPPAGKRRGTMPAVGVPPSSTDTGGYSRVFPPLDRRGGCRNDNRICSTRHKSDSLPLGDVSKTTHIEGTFPTSSSPSTCTGRDSSRGPLLPFLSDTAPPPLTPTSPTTQEVALSVHQDINCPGKPCASTDSSHMPADLTRTLLGGVEEDVVCPPSQSRGQSDEGASPSSPSACTPCAMDDGAHHHIDVQPALTVEKGPQEGELTSSLQATRNRSEDTEAELLAPHLVQRTALLSSTRNSDSSGEPPAGGGGDESAKSALQTVSLCAGSSNVTDEAAANVPGVNVAAATSSYSCVGPLTPINTHTSHREEMDKKSAGGFPLIHEANSGFSTRETFPIPHCCPDDFLRGDDKNWAPGKPLRIAYVTWNMANKKPRTNEVSAYCIYPNAHIVVVGTQENGPYVMSNKHQRRWIKTVSQVCLGGQYELVGKHHMWAVQMLVFARRRDVAHYISRAHVSHVRTGLLNGLCGNKGGVAVGLVLSLMPKDVGLPSDAKAHLTTASSLQASSLWTSTYESQSMRIRRTETTPPNLTSSLTVERQNSTPFMGSKTPASRALGIPPPVMNKPYMLHDCDDEYGKLLESAHLPEGNRAGNLFYNGDDTVLENDDVFSPAEAISRNNSSSLSIEDADVNYSQQQTRRSESGINQHEGVVGEDDASSDGKRGSETPNYMTLLFITAHLSAHQGAVSHRNRDYRHIVYGLQLGRRGPYRKFFKVLLGRKKVLEGDDDEGASEEDDEADYWEDTSPEEDVTPLRLPLVSAVEQKRKVRRDVTEEFDFTLFGGDLNYRINGTRKAIEYVIQHHSNIRSILINNDQLSLERARGKVFQGFQEGNLLFRPTYKYEVSAGGGVTLNEYNFSHKRNRMPAYCDRILYKKRMNSAARRVTIRLYTDVPDVRSSDHRPVVALFDIGTRAYTS